MTEENILKWVQKWFREQCDGEWEHENVFQISSIDNPGWHITIGVADKGLEKY